MDSMSDTLPTIDEMLMKVQGMTPSIDSVNAWNMRKEAKAQLTRIMAAQRLDEIKTALNKIPKTQLTEYEKRYGLTRAGVYMERRIAQLTHQAQAGGEDEG